MHRQFFTFPILFLILAPLSINGLTFLQNQIIDLESNTTYFQTEVSHWTATNTLSTFTSTQCGGTWLLGGYGVTTASTTFSRDYSSLPSHNEIYFSFETWYIDLHEQANLFEIRIDGQLIKDINSFLLTSFLPPANYCGTSQNDYAESRVDGKVMHTASTLNFKLVSKFNTATNDFSIGFRKLSLLFITSSAPATSVCQVQSSTYSHGISCFCPLGQYDINGPTGCAMCASNCKTCTGPATTDCTSCPEYSSFNGGTCFSCDSSCLQCKGSGTTDCVRCDSGSFLYWNGTCKGSCVAPLVTSAEGEYQNCSLPCGSASDYYFENSTCGATCPVGNNFAQISYGDLKLCNFQCTGGSDYLYSNGSCIASCPSPFVSVIQGTERYCNFPCQGSGDYLYENGSCYANCASPFVSVIQGTERYCNFPCQGSGDYLYENGSCYANCTSPFIGVSFGVEKYCNFPCNSSKYLYGNGSCFSTCASPFVGISFGAEKYCDFPCNSSKYLYGNGSCFSTCASPFAGISFGVEKYCDFPCNSSKYLYENGSCLSTCPAPLRLITQGAEKYCNLPCLTGKYYKLKTQKCVSTCNSPSKIVVVNSVQVCKSKSKIEPTTQTVWSFLEYILTGSNIIGGIIRPNNLNSAFMVALAKLLKYVQYLDVPFPQEIRYQLRPNGTSAGFCITQMFSYAMPESLKDKFTQHSLPFYIEQSGVHSSYLVNHWQTISTYLFLFVLAIISKGVEKITISKLSEWKRLVAVVTRLRVLLKWNFLLFAIFNTYDDMVFFAILELKTLRLNSGLEILSFIICLMISAIALFLLYQTWYCCKESLQQRGKRIGDIDSSSHPAMLFYKKWEDFQVLYAGLRRNSKIKQYYLLISTTRIAYCYLIAGLLHAYPRVQTVQYLFCSLFMMFILLRYRPILDPFAYFVNLIYETLILVVNVCLVALAGYNKSGNLSEEMQYGLSKTVLICNSLVYFFSNIFSWIYIITGLILAYKVNKKKGLNAKTVWFSVPVSPYSNPGMDYDDLTYLEEAVKEDSAPKRARISKRNRIIPLNLACESDIEASLKNILSSVQRDSRSFLVVQRDNSDGQGSVASGRNFDHIEVLPQLFRRNEHTFRHFMYASQVKFINNKRKGSSDEDLYSSRSQFQSKLSPLAKQEKDLSLSMDGSQTNRVQSDLNKLNLENEEEKLKIGTLDLFNGNMSTYSHSHSSLKSPTGNRPLGRPNSIIVESLELENSYARNQRNPLISSILQNDSPILHLGDFSQRGSLCATFLASNKTPMSRRRSLFGRETHRGLMNVQQAAESLEYSPISFIDNSSPEKLPVPRKISRNGEMSFTSMSRKINSE